MDSLPPPIATSTPSKITERAAKRNRLQAGRALAIDGRSGHAHRKSGAQQRLSRDVGARGTLLHGATHHDVLDLGALDVRRVTTPRRSHGPTGSRLRYC